MTSSHVVVFATLLLLTVAPLIVQGQVGLFQLASVIELNLCLQIQLERGAFVPSQTETLGLSENTVFLVEKSEHEYYKIELFTTGKCLDYNSTTSNLCLSRCDKRELIYWKIDIHTGSVSEGSDENCIYKNYRASVSVHHCSDGFVKFKFLTVGDHHDHTLKQDDLAERFIEVSFILSLTLLGISKETWKIFYLVSSFSDIITKSSQHSQQW